MKKILSILLCGMIILSMAGCESINKIKEIADQGGISENSSGKENNAIKNAHGFYDGYAWVQTEALEDEWALIDTDGKIVFSKNGIYPYSNVYGNHFIASDNDGGSVSNSLLYLYDVDGNLLYTTGQDGLTHISILLEEGGGYVAELTYEKKDFDGTAKSMEYVDLTSMQLVSPEGKLFTDVGSNQLEGLERHDFILQKADGPQRVSNAKYKCLTNNGFFTITENEKQLFEPIEGNVLALDHKNISVLVEIGNEYFIVDQTGAKEKMPIAEIGTFITMYDGIVTHQVYSSTGARVYEILKKDGTEITVHQ